jgi:hypothetical protein
MTDLRLPALRRFAIAITVLNLLGHTLLGFEQSWAQPFVALATAYSLEIVLEWIDARANGRRGHYLGGFRALVDFLLPAHISGLACSMLLYANERLMPIVFATAAAIASKAIFRARVGGVPRHFFNPSNFGIASTLLLFPWVGIAPPYQFTENLAGGWDWLLPGVIVCTGSFLNGRFTKRLPLIAGWAGGVVAQAIVRSALHGTPLASALGPMMGVAFLLFSFYMVPDPGTTPRSPRAQVAFGAAVAIVYGVLTTLHVVFGLFFALGIVCALRGFGLVALARRVTRDVAERAVATTPRSTRVAVGSPEP